jgi:hypothetical protein
MEMVCYRQNSLCNKQGERPRSGWLREHDNGTKRGAFPRSCCWGIQFNYFHFYSYGATNDVPGDPSLTRIFVEGKHPLRGLSSSRS